MKSITLLEKTYGSYKITALNAFRRRLSTQLEELEVQINKIYNNPSNWITIELEGEDEEAAYNFLKHEYGATCSLGEIKTNTTRRGRLIQTGKYGFGLFIDIGIDSKYLIDAFLPLYTLRRQLVKDEKIPLRNIIQVYGLLDNFSLEVNIELIDQLNRKIQVSLSEEQITIFQNWVKLKLERLIVCGITRHHLKKIILRSGHFRDIQAVERMGLLEEIVICKHGTNAPGILSEIGAPLKDAQIQLFIPNNVKKYFI
ncbi:MAG: DUF2110 family protein [Promethearchaeota archaeon]